MDFDSLCAKLVFSLIAEETDAIRWVPVKSTGERTRENEVEMFARAVYVALTRQEAAEFVIYIATQRSAMKNSREGIYDIRA